MSLELLVLTLLIRLCHGTIAACPPHKSSTQHQQYVYRRHVSSPPDVLGRLHHITCPLSNSGLKRRHLRNIATNQRIENLHLNVSAVIADIGAQTSISVMHAGEGAAAH